MNPVVLRGIFDDLRADDVRGLEDASRDGPVHIMLTPDAALDDPPRFPEAERLYVLQAIRWVAAVHVVDGDGETTHVPPPVAEPDPEEPRVLVSGCFDWLHSGHVRFLEAAAEHGALYVSVGNDASVADFKGSGHPMHTEHDRRYMVQSVRHVMEAFVSPGSGWLDWVPVAQRVRPDVLVVNDDGDRPEKRAYCEANGIEYVVLRRTPKDGLPVRSSTQLRGY